MIPSTFRLISGAFKREIRSTPIRVEKFAERALDQLQRNLVEAIRPLLASPIAGGNLFAEVPFTAGVSKQLAHLLEQPYAGFIVTRVRGTAARFVEIAPTSGQAARFITLQADATCTADVYVF